MGTNPPLNRVVKKKKKDILFLHRKSGRCNTYPVMEAIKTARNVPVKVTKIVLAYARRIALGVLNINEYACNEKSLMIKLCPFLIIEDSVLNEEANITRNGTKLINAIILITDIERTFIVSSSFLFNNLLALLASIFPPVKSGKHQENAF